MLGDRIPVALRTTEFPSHLQTQSRKTIKKHRQWLLAVLHSISEGSGH